MILYFLTLVLFVMGVYCLIAKKNIIKKIIGLTFTDYAINLFIIIIGYRAKGIAPIMFKNMTIQELADYGVDPLPQALAGRMVAGVALGEGCCFGAGLLVLPVGDQQRGDGHRDLGRQRASGEATLILAQNGQRALGAAALALESVRKAREKGLAVSCDLNYRKNLWKWGRKAAEVMSELVAGCDVAIGNEEDAEKVFDIKPDKTDVSSGKVESSEFESVCHKLKEKFPRARKIIITLRGSISADHNTWSGILFNGSSFFKAPVYQITHIVDRVGGGDSFMGGLIYGLIANKDDDQKALNFAVAASCLKHTIHGDFNLVSVAEVEQLMKGDGSGRVIR